MSIALPLFKEFELQHTVTVSSGIQALDDLTGGYPGNVFNIIETPDHQSGLLMLAEFLISALNTGERCALVTLEDPLSLFQSFASWNFDFYEYLKTEQLTFLFYQPSVTTEIGLSNDYVGLLNELERLSVGNQQRVAFHQLDCLLNVHS